MCCVCWVVVCYVFLCTVVVRLLSEMGSASSEVAGNGLWAIRNLAIDDETNRRLLGEAGAAAGTHTYTYISPH